MHKGKMVKQIIEFILDKGSKKISDLLETTWTVNSMKIFYLIV